MSERGSFVTNYFYCEKCFDSASEVLLRSEKHLCSTVIPSWEAGGRSLPIIAGKLGGLYFGEEIHLAEELARQLAPLLCHDAALAVIPDNGEPSVIRISGGEVKVAPLE